MAVAVLMAFEAYFFYVALMYYLDNVKRDEFASRLYHVYTMELAHAWAKNKREKKSAKKSK